MLPQGSAFHFLFTTTESKMLSCHGPIFLPISWATSVTSSSPASKRWGQFTPVATISGPDFVSTMVGGRGRMVAAPPAGEERAPLPAGGDDLRARLRLHDGGEAGQHATDAHRLVGHLDAGELFVLGRERLYEGGGEALDARALGAHAHGLDGGAGRPRCEGRRGAADQGQVQEFT